MKHKLEEPPIFNIKYQNNLLHYQKNQYSDLTALHAALLKAIFNQQDLKKSCIQDIKQYYLPKIDELNEKLLNGNKMKDIDNIKVFEKTMYKEITDNNPNVFKAIKNNDASLSLLDGKYHNTHCAITCYDKSDFLTNLPEQYSASSDIDGSYHDLKNTKDIMCNINKYNQDKVATKATYYLEDGKYYKIKKFFVTNQDPNHELAYILCQSKLEYLENNIPKELTKDNTITVEYFQNMIKKLSSVLPDKQNTTASLSYADTVLAKEQHDNKLLSDLNKFISNNTKILNNYQLKSFIESIQNNKPLDNITPLSDSDIYFTKEKIRIITSQILKLLKIENLSGDDLELQTILKRWAHGSNINPSGLNSVG